MNKTLGVVLAGGLSSRMKKDKATLRRNHETMLEFSQSILKKCGVDEVVISGNNYQVKDAYQNLGPLGGIFSVIQQHPANALLIIPIDLPLITAKSLQQIKTIGELSNQACLYKDHPLPLYLPINAFVEQFLQNKLNGVTDKGPSIKQLLQAIPHQEITQPTTNCLFNSNTPSEWQYAQQLLKTSTPYRP